MENAGLEEAGLTGHHWVAKVTVRLARAAGRVQTHYYVGRVDKEEIFIADCYLSVGM